MTTKLSITRYRTRPPEPREPLPRPAKARSGPVILSARPEDAFAADSPDDGFGAEPFATARGSIPPANASAAPPIAAPSSDAPLAGSELDAIRREGITGRQLRLARRLAQKHGLPATSDFDAIRLLRKAGIDPMQKSSVIGLVAGEEEDLMDPEEALAAGAAPAGTAAGDPQTARPPNAGQPASRALALTPGDGVRLPQTIKPVQVPSTELRAEQSHLAEVSRIQHDIARRRRRRLVLLMARLAVFVFLPTLVAGWYYYVVATPLYAAKTEFQIQTADPAAAAGLGGLLGGTALGGGKDSIAVQGYLQSQEAMERLDAEVGLRRHFSDPSIDTIQRLAPDASNSTLYALYRSQVRISFDPSEGIVKMEVATADPETSVLFSKALLKYAEEQVDSMTTRLRTDQMAGAQQSYQEAEAKMLEAQRRVVELQEKFKVLSSEVEVSLITGQIATLEAQLTQDRLSLAQMESNAQPNKARMDPLIRRITTLESQILEMRNRMTTDNQDGLSIAKVQSELLVATADVSTRQLLLAQSLQAMETARIEANRQTRYLTVSVNPVAADNPSYPRAFEDTLVVLLIFAGIYLMISMTVAILREQVTA